MQHNSQSNKLKPEKYLKSSEFSRPTGSMHIQNVTQHERYESDFGLANGDPDNIRRQRQDYSDKWGMAHHKNSKLKG